MINPVKYFRIYLRLVVVIYIISYQIGLSQRQTYNFKSVDKIIEDAIKNRVFPSAVLVIGNEKEIIYQNGYGRLTYDDTSNATRLNTIYDLASVTKVIATTSAIMKLYDEGKINLYAPVYKYIPEFNNNNKSDIKVINLLLHNSGLPAWSPFYQTCTTPEEVMNAIYKCEKEYETGSKIVYGDYNAILLGEIVKRLSGKRLDKYCREKIFVPLSMTDTYFLVPLTEDFRIAPTEFDEYWRNQVLVGYVHDETSALLEGVAGNAGLFSTATDLYKFMRMMLNNGLYMDEKTTIDRGRFDTLFKPETVILFTSRFTDLDYYNTRALGWETKPEPTIYRPQCGDKFSNNSFGHTGYTGTSVWCDKEKKLIVIFLTNRIYPKRGNEEIKNVRPRLHDEICKILGH